MNGKGPNQFTDFLSSSTDDEGPVSTRNIPRQRKRAKPRKGRKKRREQRAS